MIANCSASVLVPTTCRHEPPHATPLGRGTVSHIGEHMQECDRLLPCKIQMWSAMVPSVPSALGRLPPYPLYSVFSCSISMASGVHLDHLCNEDGGTSPASFTFVSEHRVKAVAIEQTEHWYGQISSLGSCFCLKIVFNPAVGFSFGDPHKRSPCCLPVQRTFKFVFSLFNKCSF